MCTMFRFKAPTTGIISGPTSCGKTTFMKDVILSDLIDPIPDKIYWIYKVSQPQLEEELQHKVKFIKGMPTSITPILGNKDCHVCIILDDVMSTLGDRDDVLDLYVVGSHHCNTTVFSLVQNLYFRGRHAVAIRRNRHYHVLFNNPCDASEIMTMSRQMYPQNSNYMFDAYTKSTSVPYGYLLLDVHPKTENEHRLKSDIFDSYPSVFIPSSLNTNRKN